jgi:hypothetical protein
MVTVLPEYSKWVVFNVRHEDIKEASGKGIITKRS